LRLAVVVAVAVEVVVKAFPEVDPLPADQFAVPGHRVVSVAAIAAAFLIIAAAGRTIVVISVATCRTIVVIGVATCKIIVATAKMTYRTLARRGVKTGRTTEMMCEMIGVTGITIVIVTGLA
jgi:hypothetical protein